MNDNLQSMHGQANDALVRLLFERVSTMRGGAGHIGQAAKALTRGSSVPSDTAKVADTGSDSDSSESGGVKV